MRVAGIQNGEIVPSARLQRANVKRGVPARHEYDVGLRRQERGARLVRLDAPEIATPETIVFCGLTKDDGLIPGAEWYVPLKRPTEADALLCRGRRRAVENCQLHRGCVRRDVAKPRRVVLHRVREHNGQAGWFHGRACSIDTRSNPRAIRRASDRAET